MTAIEFDHVGKQYRLGLVSLGTISGDLKRWWTTSVLRKEDPCLRIGETNDRSVKGVSDYVWALKDIDFKVEQGDVLGIIGRNGAGKSTLLKLLSRVTGPTVGNIRARGRIGSLLEVGTGFHPEMTGRENIYMNGSILGMTKKEISAKLDEIIDFSGCERYVDTPVKRYSSGMMVRLGFAVAAHLDPEILVVDEVLAVGDAEFQKKAIGKMKDVSKGEGRTVLFVSHNMASIKSLCNNGIVLDKGSIVHSGSAKDCVDYYMQTNMADLAGFCDDPEKHRFPKGFSHEIEYIDIRILNDVRQIGTEESLEFEMTVRRNNPKINVCQFGIIILSNSDAVVGGCYSDPVELPDGSETMKVRYRLNHHQLAKGRYSLNFNISSFDYSTRIKDYDIVYDVIRFEVNFIDREHLKPFVIWPDLGYNTYRNAEVSVSVKQAFPKPFLDNTMKKG